MIHIGSIRRRMATGILVGLIMLLVLAAIGVVGLRLYRGAVDDFNFAVNHAPRRSDLAAVLGRILDSLHVIPGNREGHRLYHTTVLRRITEAHAEMEKFLGRVDELPPGPRGLRRRVVVEQGLGRLRRDLDILERTERERAGAFPTPVDVSALVNGLRNIEAEADPAPDSDPDGRYAADRVIDSLLADPVQDVSGGSRDRAAQIKRDVLAAKRRTLKNFDQMRQVLNGAPHEAADDHPASNTGLAMSSLQSELERYWAYYYQEALRRKMQKDLAGMLMLVDQLPEPYDVAVPVGRTKTGYHFLSRTVYIISGAAVCLSIGLVWLAIHGIFRPIRAVVEGASRVAQGDFNYRLRPGSHDELSQLAESFNKMTDRFQEKERDLEEQVEVRSRQLVRSERLAGVGFLAAGVAHEINNPLQAIRLASDSLISRINELFDARADEDVEAGDDIEQVRDYLGMIQREAARCREITTRLLDFARGEKTERTQADLTQIIREVLQMVSHMSRFRDRTIHFATVAPVRVDVHASQIKQVVLNLIANALEATHAGGHLEIRVIERTDDIIVEFQDDGCGMTPDVIQEVFEPFATHRRDGKGTGLGLCISERIVREHNGTLEAHSEGPGQGSTFRLRLPRRVPQNSAA